MCRYPIAPRPLCSVGVLACTRPLSKFYFVVRMDYARQKLSNEEYNQDHAQRDDRLELAVILSLIVSHPAAVKFLRTLLVDGASPNLIARSSTCDHGQIYYSAYAIEQRPSAIHHGWQWSAPGRRYENESLE